MTEQEKNRLLRNLTSARGSLLAAKKIIRGHYTVSSDLEKAISLIEWSIGTAKGLFHDR